MLELSEYGDVLRQYEGEGKMYHQKRMIDCSFEIIQFSDGHIRVRCIFSARSGVYDENIGEAGERVLEGVTNENRPLILEGKLLCTLFNPGSEASQNYYIVAGGPSRLKVGTVQSAKVFEARFGLTNFCYTAIKSEEISPGSFSLNLMPLEIDGTNIIIRKLPDYKERAAILQARGGVNITCHAHVKINSSDDIVPMQEKIKRLTDLLSIAKGTLISCIYIDVVSEHNQILYSESIPVITFNYSSSYDLLESEDIKLFAESAYKSLLQLDPIFNFTKVIHGFVDVRSSNGFLETRGLMLSALVEYVATAYASRERRELIMHSHFFELGKDPLEEGNKKLIKEIFPELKKELVSAMAAKTRGFNYTSLGSRLRLLRRVYKVPISNSAIESFIASRNNLAHDATFDSPNEPTTFHEMLNFMDRLILSILGYRGQYIDVRTFTREKLED